MTTDDEDIASRADLLYAARSALAEISPRRRPGVAEIARFLNDPARSLSMQEQQALFSDPDLRAAYRRLKSLASVADMPALAAASAGEVNARRFDGGTVAIHPSRVQGQTYVILRFSWPAAPPRMILLEGTEGALVKRALPPADANGEVMMVLDHRRDPDAQFLRLMSDPTSTGSFLL
jgi:hypothetical protein